MRVQDLMIREVATVRPNDDLGRAVRSMERHDCGCVVVVDDASRVAGILTDRDACLAALHTDRPLSRLETTDFMRKQVFTCAPDDSVDEAERRMGEHQVRRLPVVDAGGRLCGILSLDDIAEKAWREEDLILPAVSEKDVGRTLGQIGRPHVIQPE